MDTVAFLGTIDSALAEATVERPVLVEFWRDTSADCARIAHHTYRSPEVVSRFNRLFVPVKIGLHDDSAGLGERFRVAWTPCFVVLDASGSEVYRETGFLPEPEFAVFLEFARAMADLAAHRHRQARDRLEHLRREHADSARGPDILYWLGVAAYAADHDPATLGQYRAELLENYPESLAARRVPPLEPRI
jgi:hypothetical protein